MVRLAALASWLAILVGEWIPSRPFLNRVARTHLCRAGHQTSERERSRGCESKGTTKSSRTALGFGCGSTTDSAADLRLRSFDYQNRELNLPDLWRRRKRKMLRRNSQRGSKTCSPKCKTATRLETDSLGSNPVLRKLKDGAVIRPLSANASTVKALQERRLIHAAKGRDPLTIVWRLSKK